MVAEIKASPCASRRELRGVSRTLPLVSLTQDLFETHAHRESRDFLPIDT